MEMQSVSSSNIASVGYDEEKKILHVTFNQGRTWEYTSVPKEVFDAFLSASSKGQYFHKHIRSAYSYMEV